MANEKNQIFIFTAGAFFFVAIISYLVTAGCVYYGYCVTAADARSVSAIEVFGFAGTMATILAFVATFAIALMVIDAVAISSNVRSAANNIDKFSDEVGGIEKRLKYISMSIGVFDLIIKEIDEASEESNSFYGILEVLGVGAQAGDVVARAILDGRKSASDRRARINGIRYLASKKFNGSSPPDFDSSLPELINLARGGDKAAKSILFSLKDLGISGIPDAFD